MQPVVTIAQMQAADAEALRTVEESVLVTRAGTAVAASALEMLGGAYGRRVVVIAGRGNNGADGRVAAEVLRRRGARVTVVGPGAGVELPESDLVIDAAYGTGFRGTYEAPVVPARVPVLAVDIPSGVSGDTGAASGRPLRATRTVTFAALKAGLVQGDGSELAGEVVVADIGIPIGPVDAGVMDDDDVGALLPRRRTRSHKWETAVAVVAGSPGMEGAAALCAMGASHAGAGMVRLAVPGSADPGGGTRSGPWPLEAVRVPLGESGWAGQVLELLDRCRALVVGPGLGRTEATRAEVRRLVAHSPVPVVADADALAALGDADAAREVVAGLERPVVLTPHDGEYRSLAGHSPGADRLSAARDLAHRTGAVVLLKGSPTVVAHPADVKGGPSVLVSVAGSSRLSTAGTGDVLSGVIGAFLARGMGALAAAALAAHVHGRAAGSGPAEGLAAGDLPVLVSRWLSDRVGRG
ncbi:MAG TPA: NAD(P)H-hydrate dehydratase [Acidimicrobiales bacterium]|nr:NAD(P)H-hydrate dehydratase [Acidimicrobiales bacterium]